MVKGVKCIWKVKLENIYSMTDLVILAINFYQAKNDVIKKYRCELPPSTVLFTLNDAPDLTT